MNLYYDISNNVFVNNTVSTVPAIPLLFFENDIIELNVTFLTLNPTGGSTNPYNTYGSGSVMTIAMGVPAPDTTNIILVDQKTLFQTGSIFTGSLSISGSDLQTLMISGSDIYLEIQEETATGYFTTLYQDTVRVIPDLYKN